MDTEAITTFNDTAKCAPWQLFAFSQRCHTGCLTAPARATAPSPDSAPAIYSPMITTAISGGSNADGARVSSHPRTPSILPHPFETF